MVCVQRRGGEGGGQDSMNEDQDLIPASPPSPHLPSSHYIFPVVLILYLPFIALTFYLVYAA